MNRSETILATADALFGAITMAVVLSLFPDASPAPLRRLMCSLVARGALIPAWSAGTGQRVWLTTRSAAGRVSGLRKWLADSDALRSALVTKNAGTVVPPVTFAHAQAAGQIVAGLGVCGREFDSELHTGGAGSMADGVAYPAPDWRLAIEVERMIRQGQGRWQKQGGLIDKIIAGFGQSASDGALSQHLVAFPKFGGERVGERTDFEQKLGRMVAEKAAQMTGLPRDSGWWFLPLDALETNPVWHPIFAGTPAPRALLGISKRRENFVATHAKNAEIDRARKLRAAVVRAGVSLPAGVTMLPQS